MARALIIVTPPWATLRTPYQPEFVERLKLLVDRYSRSWMADEKVWRVDEQYLDDVIALCEEFFFPVTVRREAPAPKPPPPPTLAHQVLHVAADAPPEVVEAAYRAMSKLFHPDLHPELTDATARMQAINSAYQFLKEHQPRRRSS